MPHVPGLTAIIELTWTAPTVFGAVYGVLVNRMLIIHCDDNWQTKKSGRSIRYPTFGISQKCKMHNAKSKSKLYRVIPLVNDRYPCAVNGLLALAPELIGSTGVVPPAILTC